MNMLQRILIVALCLLTPIVAHANAKYPNEPSGLTTATDCTFSGPTTSVCGIVDLYNSGIFTSDSTAPTSPSGVMKSLLLAYHGTGGGQWIYNTPSIVREMFVGHMWRTNPQFQGRIVSNKLFFVRGPVLGNAFWGMDGRLVPQMSTQFGPNTSGLDNSHTCAGGGFLCYPNVSNQLITIGAWTKFEVYVKSSTTATSRDGIVRWWVNGVLTGNYTNMNYAPGGLNEWQWNNTWDGAQDMGTSNTVDWEHWLDDLHISTGNGSGSGGSTPVDTTPPGRATGLTITQLN